jgi:PHD/YefM family antitoxin component YafN of YafNO toxin-antitoxin module
MRFVSSRELRIRPGVVWSLLRAEQDLVITANGKPVGVMTAVDEGSLEDVLATLRQGRAQSAVARLRREATRARRDQVPTQEITRVIARARRAGRRRIGAARG